MTSMGGWFSLAALVFTVFSLIAAFQAWCLWQVGRALAALLPLEERVTRLNHSLGMLVDTTQGCFDALAAQVAQRGERALPMPAVTSTRPATASPPATAHPAGDGQPTAAAASRRWRRQARSHRCADRRGGSGSRRRGCPPRADGAQSANELR